MEQLSSLDDITYKAMMPDSSYELPYEGAKEMLLVDDIDNREIPAVAGVEKMTFRKPVTFFAL